MPVQPRPPVAERAGDPPADAPRAQGTDPAPVRLASSLADPSITIPVYVLLVTAAFFVFQAGEATLRGNEMSRQQALFTAVNAATLTGFQQARSISEFTATGQAVTFLLMLTGVAFSWIVGGVAVVRIAKLPFTPGQLVLAGTGLLAAVAAGGAIAGWSAYGAVWPGVFQAVAAVANCGLGLRRPPGGQAWAAALLLAVALVGGLGLPVLLDLLTGVRRRRWSLHTEAVLSSSATVYLTGLVLLLLTFWFGAGETGAWRGWFVSASREALNSRSAGLPFESVAQWPRGTQWVVLGLMLIGAAPAGTGGGLKVTTVAVLVAGVRESLKGRAPGRLFGAAAVWVTVYVVALLACLLVLLGTEPQIPADRVLFLAGSALGNVGLSHDPVAVSNAGLYTLSVTMLAGRVLPVLVLWTLADQPDPKPLVAIG